MLLTAGPRRTPHHSLQQGATTSSQAPHPQPVPAGTPPRPGLHWVWTGTTAGAPAPHGWMVSMRLKGPVRELVLLVDKAQVRTQLPEPPRSRPLVRGVQTLLLSDETFPWANHVLCHSSLSPSKMPATGRWTLLRQRAVSSCSPNLLYRYANVPVPSLRSYGCGSCPLRSRGAGAAGIPVVGPGAAQGPRGQVEAARAAAGQPAVTAQRLHGGTRGGGIGARGCVWAAVGGRAAQVQGRGGEVRA